MSFRCWIEVLLLKLWFTYFRCQANVDKVTLVINKDGIIVKI